MQEVDAPLAPIFSLETQGMELIRFWCTCTTRHLSAVLHYILQAGAAGNPQDGCGACVQHEFSAILIAFDPGSDVSERTSWQFAAGCGLAVVVAAKLAMAFSVKPMLLAPLID